MVLDLRQDSIGNKNRLSSIGRTKYRSVSYVTLQIHFMAPSAEIQ